MSVMAIAIVLALNGTLSHLLAHAGHPQSLWLWRDVLGVVGQ